MAVSLGTVAKIVAALAILSAIAALAFVAYLTPVKKEAQGGEIEIYLQPSRVAENSRAAVLAFSSCGPFSLYLDGKLLGQAESQIRADITAAAGSHLLSAEGTRCSRSLSFEAVQTECNDGENRSCTAGDCDGTQECRVGAWDACRLPQKKCVPGEKVGCSVDSCKFGYRTCNSCGTGFGQCLPRGGTDDGTLIANSAACAP